MELGDILTDDNGNRLIAVPIINKKNPCEGCFYCAEGGGCGSSKMPMCWDKYNNEFILRPINDTKNQGKEADMEIPQHPVDIKY